MGYMDMQCQVIVSPLCSSSRTHATGSVSCSRIPLPALYPDRFQSFPKLSVLRMGWAGWNQVALSQVCITGSHLCRAPPCPLALFCGPSFGSTGHFCAQALEMRGKDTQGVGQGCWEAAEHHKDRHSSQTGMGCSECCCRASSFLQPHEKPTVTIKLPSTHGYKAQSITRGSAV